MRHPMLILFATVLIDLIGFGIIIPILPFMAPDLGASNFDIALIIAVYSVCGGLVGPLWGRLSDRIGRKPVLLICLGGAGVSYVLLAYSQTLAMLYASRILAGLMSGNFAVASAMVADLSPPSERAKSMGLMGAAFGLGLVIGPFLGGILAGDDGQYFRVGMVAAGMSFTALIVGIIQLPESHARKQRHLAQAQQREAGKVSIWRMLQDNNNTLLAGLFFLQNSCHTTVSYLFPLWVGSQLGWGAKDVGIIFGIQGLAMAALQGGLIGHLVRRLGELPLLLLGSSVMTLGFVIATQAETSATILWAFFTTITGGTLCTPVLNALVANRTPAHLRGRMLGTTGSSAAFGRVAGPLLGGVLLSTLGFHGAWLGGALAALLIAAWALEQIRRPPHLLPPFEPGDVHGT